MERGRPRTGAGGSAVFRRILAALAGLMVFVGPLRAETVVLSGGDELHGQVISENSRRVILEHPDLGWVTIPRSRVAEVRQDESATVLREIEPEAADVPVQTGVLVNGAEAEPEASVAEKGGELPVKKESKWRDQTFFERMTDGDWLFSFSFGGVLTNDDEGEKFTLNSRFSVDRIAPTQETTGRLIYLFKTTDGEITDNELTARLGQRFRSPGSPWYWAVNPRYDFNEFRSWRHRVQLHGALGYFLMEQDRVRLSLEGGAGGRRDFGSEQDVLIAEGLAGVVLQWFPTKRQELRYSTTWYPGLNRQSHRFVTDVEWTFRITDEVPLGLNTALEWEWDTNPDPGFPENNIRLTFGVQYDF